MRFIVLIAAIISCGPSEGPPVYHGIPDGETPACSWNILHKDTGECIAGGKRYRCIQQRFTNDDTTWLEISCSSKVINPIHNILEGIAPKR